MKKHKHHIVPRHRGGSNDPSNIVEVTQEEHYKLHYEKWINEGSYLDLAACQLLQKNHLRLTDEEKRINASRGGKAGSKVQIENKIGIHGQSAEERKFWGDYGREVAKEMGVGFYNSKLQSELGKRGGPKNKGFKWLTNGVDNIKYSKRLQKEKSIKQFLLENLDYKQGRTLPWMDKKHKGEDENKINKKER